MQVPESMKWSRARFLAARSLSPITRDEIAEILGRKLRERDTLELLRIDHIRVNVEVRALGSPVIGNQPKEYR